MGRRQRDQLDEWLDDWARWCNRGMSVQPISILARLSESQGVLIPSTAADGPSDDRESTIESVVLKLALRDVLLADVLRLEYAAGWQHVVSRRAVRGYSPATAGNKGNASVLGVSQRTYQRRLAMARAIIRAELEE